MAAGAFALHFLSWCSHVISVEAWDGTFDVDGTENYIAQVSMPCRIEERVRLVRTMQGEERVSNTQLYVLGGPLNPHDKITMPATFKGLNPPTILAVSNVEDATEFSHCEVFL